MPPIYGLILISFFSHRFFRSYNYYSLAETGELAPHLFQLFRSQFFACVYEVRDDVSFSEIQDAQDYSTQGYHHKRLQVSTNHSSTDRPLTLT
jgi:hypothetical protein